MKFRFSYSVHYYITLTSIILLAIGMPLNKIMMSVGAMLGVFNLLLERDFKTYYTNLKNNKPFLWLLAFFLLHVIGLIWTNDFGYAAKDIKIKLPLLAVPLALVSKPIREQHIRLVLNLLIGSLIVTSVINFGNYYQLFGNRSYIDIREMSLFGSHIRYGILVALGIGSCIYLMNQKSNWKYLYYIFIIWLTIYTFYSQVISGGIALIIVYLLFIFKWLFTKHKLLSFVFSGGLFLITFTLFNFFKLQESIAIDISKLPQKTAEGNFYTNDLLSSQSENNQPVYISICDKELKREWEKISSIKFENQDLKKQNIRYTIIRYLTSKGYSKDAIGIKKLKKEDISNIEQGIASVNELKSGLIARLYTVRFQLNNNGNPNGHSLLQRFEYWKTATEIIKENWLIGVGTGDVQTAFDKQYKKDNSTLTPNNRLRAHNMYLTIFVTFGIVGLLIFIGFLYHYLKFNLNSNHFLFFVAIVVIAITFLIEDTIETQLGVSIVAFFVSLGLQRGVEDSAKQGLPLRN